MGPADGVELVDQPVLIPILRAGLGMLDAGLEALAPKPAFSDSAATRTRCSRRST